MAEGAVRARRALGHFAATPSYETAETTMLQSFAAAVTPARRAELHDAALVGPFANLKTGTGAVKNHGIRRATGELLGAPPGSGPQRRASPKATATASPPTLSSRGSRADGAARSQRVTARDLSTGQLRFPSASKALFPPAREYVEVNLRGRVMAARWDPRTGPDTQRSGLLAFGRGKLDDMVAVDEVLAVAGGDGEVAVHLS